MFKRILAATDGSEHAGRAVKAAADLARAFSAQLTVMAAAYIPPMYKVDMNDELQMSVRDSTQRILDEARDDITGMSIKPEFVLTSDQAPAAAVIEQARDRGCDLVVLGRRGLHAGDERPLGAISDAVLRGAGCSVMLVQ